VETTILQDVDLLKQRLAPHLRKARKAIVFGSVARGEADEWSDLDLVIVADTRRPFLERYQDFEGIYDVWLRLDLRIYTPDEFAQMLAEGRPSSCRPSPTSTRRSRPCGALRRGSTSSTSPLAIRTAYRVVSPRTSSPTSRRPRRPSSLPSSSIAPPR